jgi:hypothetical protein
MDLQRRAKTSQGLRPENVASISSHNLKKTPDILSTSYLDDCSYSQPLAPAIDTKKKLEDNEAKLIHELYNAHFGGVPASTKSNNA